MSTCLHGFYNTGEKLQGVSPTTVCGLMPVSRNEACSLRACTLLLYKLLNHDVYSSNKREPGKYNDIDNGNLPFLRE